MAAISPEQLAKWLAEVLGPRLMSVVLYGSAAAGDFVEGESNFNLLVMIEPLGVAELKAAGQPLATWHRAGHVSPMLFTPDQLMASLDAFPIEMLDIQQSRRVLFGSDLLAGVRIEPTDLRRAVERELTGKLLSLRAKYALAADKPRAVQELMLGSLSTFLVLFRAALRLYESAVPETKLDATHALAKHISFDTSPFEQLFAIKERSSAERSIAPDVSFSEYLAGIEAVTAAINLFNSSKGQT
jgi:hypothetical protein